MNNTIGEDTKQPPNKILSLFNRGWINENRTRSKYSMKRERKGSRMSSLPYTVAIITIGRCRFSSG